MAKGDHKFRGKPKGATGGGYVRPRIQVGLDDDQRDAIAKWAAYHNRSLTAECRKLIAEGLKQRTR